METTAAFNIIAGFKSKDEMPPEVIYLGRTFLKIKNKDRWGISVICDYRIGFSCDSRWYEHKWNLIEPKPGLSKSIFCIPHVVSPYPLGLPLAFYKDSLLKQPASDRLRGAKF